LVALVPLLASGGAAVPDHVPWLDVAKGVAAVAVVLVGGRFLVRPLFRVIGGTRTPEVFTATALLVVVGTAALAHWAGLSMSLGAFMAGVLLSDSEYRHELQADIEPFEGLLLGFFFLSVGMSADLGVLTREPALVALAVVGLLVAKVVLAFALGLIRRGTVVSSLRFALALWQGSEFSFVLFAVAVANGILPADQANLATLTIAVSMVATPMLFAASERLLVPQLGRRREPVYDAIDASGAPVIICGFGRFGQVVGRLLRMQNIGFTALDKDAGQIEVVRRFGYKVYYGDPAREDMLRAAGADTARVLVIALDDMEATLRVAAIACRRFPHLAVFARARNRRHAHLLMDLGITGIVRETFFSSLRLSELVLMMLGHPPSETRRAIELFREHDERNLVETHAFAGDEQQLIQSARQAADELTQLFEADRGEAREAAPARGG
jgi:CPA2 family monovalent cation:H+ antiporter-2/glutathione-regulated potassium-efflux system protein KefB